MEIMSLQEFYLKQPDETKVETYDKIITHLFMALSDKREREKKRASIALKTIKGWIEEIQKGGVL